MIRKPRAPKLSAPPPPAPAPKKRSAGSSRARGRKKTEEDLLRDPLEVEESLASRTLREFQEREEEEARRVAAVFTYYAELVEEVELEEERLAEDLEREHRRTYTDGAIARALVELDGFVYLAAESLGCSTRWIYKRARENAKLGELLDTILPERNRDVAESAVMRAIRAGDMSTARWFLDRKGRDRGYGELVQVENRREIIVELPADMLDGEDPLEEDVDGDADAEV
jgi:hypothetical protein